jgi:hypothetical protein
VADTVAAAVVAADTAIAETAAATKEAFQLIHEGRPARTPFFFACFAGAANRQVEQLAYRGRAGKRAMFPRS